MKAVQLKNLLWIVWFLPTLIHANFPSLPAAPLIIPGPPSLAAKSYILIDPQSDCVVVEQNANQRVEPASLTKMMTVYVVDQALKNNKIKLNDSIRISEAAWRQTGSRMFLELNSEVTVAELLNGIIIQSGNDASVAIAEHIGGAESAFAELMNFYAKQLGMQDTHFVNATGLPDPNHYTTARDMGLLAKALIQDFPESYKIYSQKEFIYKNIKQQNRNRLLWQNENVDGIKTGHTESAGYCLVASGQKEGMRLIAVLMGAASDNLRTDETNKLLTYGFRFYETRKLYPALTTIKQTRIWMGKEHEVHLGLAHDLYVTLGRGQYDRLKTNINTDPIIKAPLDKGSTLGTITVQLDDKTLIEQPMVSLNAVEKAGFFSRTYDSISITFQSLWGKIKS
jgi:D-alanyl-D-alanine carboxypeptidase (penicillin-binding protein 5/6)